MTAQLLEDIERYCLGVPLQVTVTLNIPETLGFDTGCFRFPLHFLQNFRPQGFATNHNAAFMHGQREYPCDYFCVINPDIRLLSDPFPELLDCLEEGHAGVVAPLVLNTEGRVEDSARCFPTPLSILAKALGRGRQRDKAMDRGIASPDWVAGMFMLIPSKIFQRIGGFDERYFLYYEDVDLCARLRVLGYDVRVSPNAHVIHDARRQSHRDIKYFRWHLSSMIRYFLSPGFRSMMWRRLGRR